jgi:oligopeptide transport system substrate-binding protein
MRKLLVITLVLLVAFTAFAGGKKEEAPAPAPKQEAPKPEAPKPAEAAKPAAPVTMTILNGAEPPSLDPSLSEDTASHNILLGLNEGLLVYDPQTNDGAPGVAESYTVSEDGKTWTFKIRKNAKWSDGVAINAKTVVDSWLRSLDPKTASPYAWLMGMVVEGADAYNTEKGPREGVKIRALDDYTFQMDMVGPVPYVTSMLPHSIFGILPLHAIEKFGDKWTLPGNHVSNGPYIMTEWQPQDHITVVKNPNYWDAANVKVGKIVYIASDDDNTRLKVYLNGEADWMNKGIPPDQMDAMKVRPDYHVNPALATYFYEFNHTQPPFNDVRLRKALSMAFDKQVLVDKVSRGGQLPADTVVPKMAGYTSPKGNGYNLEAARKLLAEAGYPGGKGFPPITILYNTSEGHKKIAEYIQQQWSQNLGINMSIENVEWKTVLARGGQQDFQVLRMGWIGDYQDPNTFLELFQTDAGQNYGKYSNARFDELIQKAARMKAGPERFAALKQAEEIFILQDQGIIPIYFYTNLHLVDTSKWGGWYETTTDWHPPKAFFKK